MNLIIALHRLSERPDYLDKQIGNVVSIKCLEGLVNKLKDHSFVALSSFFERRGDSNSLISFTFDDGNSSVYELAYPFLSSRGIPFSIFVNSRNLRTGEPHWFELVEAGIMLSPLDELFYFGERFSLRAREDRLSTLRSLKRHLKKQVVLADDLQALLVASEVSYQSAVEWARQRDRILTQFEISKLSSERVEVGSHGCQHHILARLSEAEQELEIISSKREIELITGRPCQYFSYPNGWITDYNLTTIRLLRLGGYLGAVTARASLVEALTTSSAGVYEMPRWCPSEKDLVAFLNSS